MRKLILAAGFALFFLASKSQVSFTAGDLTLGLDKQGLITEILSSVTGKNYLSTVLVKDISLTR
jgi:hypothetical protein